MPRSPKRPCRMNGCHNIAVDGEVYCVEHKKNATHEYNHYRRDYESRSRYGRAWKRIRDRKIKENPLCEECLKDSRLVTAEEVHHILPLSDGGTHERSNLISLCHSCHMKAHATLGTRTPHKE